MNNVIERCLSTFGMMQSLTEYDLKKRRAELSNYIASLQARGEMDEHRLAVSGLTYLRRAASGIRSNSISS